MFGLGAKLFAIPIEAMVYRPGDDVFVVNISKYRIDNEPGFVEGEWPREANWDLIESTRPIGPPSQEEARAVTRTEPPPREVVTTERMEVQEKPTGEEVLVVVEEAEAERPVAIPGPSLKHLSAADLQVYLEGMNYPAEKADLINQARERNASADVIATLEQFSEKTYLSAADVTEEFERVR